MIFKFSDDITVNPRLIFKVALNNHYIPVNIIDSKLILENNSFIYYVKVENDQER